MTRIILSLTLFACSSAPTPSARPSPSAQASASDAGVDAAPDAGVPDAVASAPAWVFRFSSPERSETWTLRYHDASALLVVESTHGVVRYVGSATDGATLALNVSTGTAKMALECKHAKRSIGAKCNDRKAKPIEVLDCYHPDFKEPMPFGPAPGVEYAQSASCTGYRLLAP